MSPVSSASILVVDDQAANIRLMRSILQPEGYNVASAKSGESALLLAQTAPQPDLILLDAMMPGMDGYTVCSRLKSIAATRQIPVIFVTAVDDTQTEARCFALGAADYITKPVELPTLLARVKTHLALYTQQRSLEGMFRDVLEFAPDALVLSDSDGHIVRVNAQAERLFGYARQDLVGQLIDVLIPERARAGHPAQREGFATSHATRRMGQGLSVQARHKDGSICDVEINLSRIATAQGVLFVSSLRDITERKAAETNLRIAATAFEAQEGIVVTDRHDVVLRSNQAFSRITGYSASEVIGRKMNFLKSTRHGAEFWRAFWQAMVSDGVWHGEIWNRHKSGQEHPHWLTVSAVKDALGAVSHYVGTYTDITERKAVEADLRIAAAAFETQEGVVVTDANSVILRINPAFARMSGYSVEELVGKSPKALQSGRHDAGFYREMWNSIGRTGGWQGEVWDRRKNGEIYPKWLSISEVRDRDGVITHYVGTQSDITLRKEAEQKIHTLAFFDSLTGLPNRTLLMDRLKQAMTATDRADQHGALLFIDLDNFKSLNDTLGHDVGDMLLKHVAQRLTQCVREGDTVARLGGDEFVVLLVNLSADQADAAIDTETVASKIIATLNLVYRFGTSSHHSTASMGATLFKGSKTSTDDLIKQTDLTMYKAKDGGRNTFRFFNPAMELALNERAALETDLRQAVEAQQFLLHYQAQVNEAGLVTGAEVLLRWQHPKRGMVSPADFIPLAESTGLILPLGQWVLETACNQLALWASQPDMAHLTVAVNVSAHQFRQSDFVEHVLRALHTSGANPRRLKLELTESLLVDNIGAIIDTMSTLKGHGVGFSLDDFGTGYSSLSYLKRLPLDQLKIDQSFVRDVMDDPNDAAIARTIVALSEGLGLSVIAEGVETLAQRDFLASAGCHAYQGYFFGRPMPLGGFEALVRQTELSR
ncbi:MAG: EAL domain-containing protein [Burkholderiales bacterium]